MKEKNNFMKNLLINIFFLFTFLNSLTAQDKFSFDGYISDMQSVYKVPDLDWLWENNLHNRLNFNIYPFNWLSGSLQMRNRLIMGNTVVKFPGYAENIDADNGWVDLSFTTDGTFNDNSGYVLNTNIDRLWLQFTAGPFEAKIGRQRINWGQTFVWNPNDIFNSYSYFEVDYPERPGSDAIRLQYYPGMASTIELAAKIDSSEKLTAAAYFRTNALKYDLQVLGGVYSGKDLVLGTGWSGNIWNIAFRGELSYFKDLEHFSDTTGYVMVSTGFDYTFSNSLWIQLEALYSGFAKEMNINNFLEFYSGNLDVKSLGFTEWSLFASLSYPFTPLLNGGIASIYYPEWKGFYLGPNIDISVFNNINLSLIIQYFSAEFEVNGIKSRENNALGFLRMKWSF